jgi:hypothetical protein
MFLTSLKTKLPLVAGVLRNNAKLGYLVRFLFKVRRQVVQALTLAPDIFTICKFGF